MYSTIDEQTSNFIDIISENNELMDILDYVSQLNLPNFYIAAGSIFQTVWNYYDKKALNYNIKDIDIIYFDNNDLRVEKDLEIYNKVISYSKSRGYNYDIDVSNEARMHIWKKINEGINIEPYSCSEDAISRWIATVHAIGITKINGNIKIYAPYGLSDILTKTIRPIKHKHNSKKLYDEKVASWTSRFDNLNVIEW